ncbi:hypothetical protein T4E_4694 [Trichinella pseudospiralis]|uniref:Uncharacterized protein n=1 Tax=Trichinella pseudospiralis TaxID=6337 RepID=A0A0V0YJ86_TRIPS|nr:hypothetical protein T4E_4694 [Trichinella pseudospiralis]
MKFASPYLLDKKRSEKKIYNDAKKEKARERERKGMLKANEQMEKAQMPTTSLKLASLSCCDKQLA